MCVHLLSLMVLYDENPSAFTFFADTPSPPVALVDFGIAKVMETWEEENAAVILHGHNEAVLSIASSPDGKFFATGSADGIVRLFRWKDGQLV